MTILLGAPQVYLIVGLKVHLWFAEIQAPRPGFLAELMGMMCVEGPQYARDDARLRKEARSMCIGRY